MTDSDQSVLHALADGVLTIRLNRPDTHNALSPDMIRTLTTLLRDSAENDDVRVIVLTGRGRSFCAGADLNYMRQAADFTFSENVADGETIFDLMLAAYECPKPMVARVNGAAIGGGVGLVACCDIAVSAERAIFALTEVRLGITAAVISPFVLNKIGVSNGHELFLTGERFNANHAHNIGLVHHVVANETELDARVEERVQTLLLGAPGAQATSKALIRDVAYRPLDELRAVTAEIIARRRASDEGREGMSAFLEKRPPSWQTQPHEESE